MKVIALTGRAGSGKDTVATAIRILTGSLDPTWMAPKSTKGSVYDESQKIDWKEVFDAYWPNQSTNESNQWKVLRFAEPVYQVAAILTGHDPDEDIMTNEFKNSHWIIGSTFYKGREILQKVGAQLGREIFDKCVWIGLLKRKLVDLERDGYSGVIIADCRMINEAEFLAEWGATIIKITGRNSGLDQSHPSESELEHINWDFQIDNNGDYNDLIDKVDYVCHKLKISNHKYTWK